MATKSEAASKSRNLLVEPYGVGVTPAVYLVNFLLLYMANPSEAANMPAYRAAVPEELYDCLKDNPEGCPYDDFEKFFDQQVEGGASILPNECRAEPKWEVLAPSIAKHPDQINEPLGKKRADALARRLGIDKSMILTDSEYQCTIGTPAIRDLDPHRETMSAAMTNTLRNLGPLFTVRPRFYRGIGIFWPAVQHQSRLLVSNGSPEERYQRSKDGADLANSAKSSAAHG